MSSSRLLGLVWVLTSLVAASLTAAEPVTPASPADLEFFEKQVRPILVEHCFACHGPEKQRAGLRVDSRAALLKGGDTGPAFVPGKPAESLLVSAINYNDDYKMPPRGKLKDEQIAALTSWVSRGAPWPVDDRPAAAKGKEFNLAERAQRWSFQPLGKSEPPVAPAGAGTLGAVDRFLRAKLTAAKLQPAPPTDRRALLRRATYDLTGLPPTPDELAAFVADERPDAYERVLDRLLASPRYGERMARHWLDLARYAETYGHEFDFEIPHAWRYRDYLIRAFNNDLPYDQFVREQIAGDLLAQPRHDTTTGTNESLVATNFFWLGEQVHSPVDLHQNEADRIDNQIDVLGKTFLGLTIACARCHDHKFDPIRAADYYALFGILQSSRYAQLDVVSPEHNRRVIADLAGLKKSFRAKATAALRPQVAKLDTDLLAAVEAIDARQPPLEPELPGKNTKSADPLLDAAKPEKAKTTAEPLTADDWAWHFGEARDPSHPLFVWAELRKRNQKITPAMIAEIWRRVVVPEQQPAKRTGDRLLADFSQPLPAGWRAHGLAFEGPVAQLGDWLVGNRESRPIAGIVTSGMRHTGLVSNRLQGTLQSPDFTLDERFVHVRVAGWQTRIRLVIDGFQMIRSPIYGGLTRVNASDHSRWITFDAKMWQGHRAYLEFNDLAPQDPGDPTPRQVNAKLYGKELPPETPEENIYGGVGWLAIEQVVLSNDGPPAVNSSLARLLGAEPPQSVAELAARYRTVASAALETWATDPTKLDAASAGLLDWVLGQTPAGKAPEAASDVRAAWQAYRDREAELQRPQYALALADGNTTEAKIYLRGNPKTPGPSVPHRFLEVFAGDNSASAAGLSVNSGSDRLALAEQMLTTARGQMARVYVNRLWLHTFGTSLVPTPDDFGYMGENPSHPELLDWLAGELIREGWSTKKLLRTLLLSDAYRMSSRLDPAAAEIDPENKLYHHQPARRIEVEAMRDGMLAVSGKLDVTMYGPSVPPHLTAFMAGRGRPGRMGPVDGAGRRSLYLGVRRNFLNPMFLAFDFPQPFSTMGRRSVSHVPAQALALMNNPLVIEQAQHWAKRIVSDPALADDAARLTRMYVEAYAREPASDELDATREFLAAQRAVGQKDEAKLWSDVAHTIFNTSEFIFLR